MGLSVASLARIRIERLAVRAAPEPKVFFDGAANLLGLTPEKFIVESMRGAAVRTIEEPESLLSTIVLVVK